MNILFYAENNIIKRSAASLRLIYQVLYTRTSTITGESGQMNKQTDDQMDTLIPALLPAFNTRDRNTIIKGIGSTREEYLLALRLTLLNISHTPSDFPVPTSPPIALSLSLPSSSSPPHKSGIRRSELRGSRVTCTVRQLTCCFGRVPR